MYLREALEQLAAKYLDMPKEEYEYYMRYDSVVSIIHSLYQFSVTDKELIPIEKLPQEQKGELWKRACFLRKEADLETKIRISKALYVKDAL